MPRENFGNNDQYETEPSEKTNCESIELTENQYECQDGWIEIIDRDISLVSDEIISNKLIQVKNALIIICNKNQIEKIRRKETNIEDTCTNNKKINIVMSTFFSKYATSNTIKALLKFPFIQGEDIKEKIGYFSKIDFLEQKNIPLLIAAQAGNKYMVDIFIDVNPSLINYRNQFGQSALDLARENERNDVVVTLLKADSEFPKVNFDETEKTDDLKLFLHERDTLHEYIEEGDLENVKKIIENDEIKTKKSKLYLNTKNESAICAAVKKEKKEIINFLKSKSLDFKDDGELFNLLKTSAEDGNIGVVNCIFYFCDPNVLKRYANENEQNPVEIAWDKNHYDVVLALLEAEFEFPTDFSVKDDLPDDLKEFVKNRQTLHKNIEAGDLDKLKSYYFNKKFIFFLNQKNESALYIAITNRQYEVYAFLQCKGAVFKNEEEKNCIDSLNQNEKNDLEGKLIPYFHRLENSHIYYILSVSSSVLGDYKYRETYESLYSELDKIHEISKILQVIQYSDLQSIIFDFDKENLIRIAPTCSLNTLGVCKYFFGRLCIAAKEPTPTNRELLGTLAHELTHWAMQIMFKNNCNPYRDSEMKEKFKEIVDEVKKKSENSEVDDIIKRVFSVYKDDDWPSELIVRVPHMLAKYGSEDGLKLLNGQALDLVNFYKETILKECQDFIDRSYLIKPINNIKMFNDYSGVINDIEELNIQFKTTVDLDRFLNVNDKKFLILETCSMLLSKIHVNQSLKNSSKCSLNGYLFFNLDRFIKKHKDIFPILHSSDNPSRLLVIAYQESCLPENKAIKAIIFQEFKNFVDSTSTSKIIFITDKNCLKFLQEDLAAAERLNIVEKIEEKQFNLSDLDEQSQEIILNKQILFQGNKICLSKLINDKDKDILDYDMLDKLIQNKIIKLSDDISISDDFKDCYIPRYLKVIKIKSDFLKKNKIDNNQIFLVSNIDQSTLEKLVPMNHENIIIVKYSECCEEFEKLCQESPLDKIYWLDYVSDSNSFDLLRSKGDLKIFDKYIDNNHDNFFSEGKFIETCKNQELVIISDPSGMGKSTILTHLFYTLKKDSSNAHIWLIRINLNDYTDIFDNSNKDNNFKSAIEFITNDVLKLNSSFEKKLIEICINEKKSIIMFDGFDEISPNYEKIVIYLFREIKGKVKQIWATTRPNMKTKLENEFNQLSHAMRPFLEEEQVKFLTNYWEKKLITIQGSSNVKKETLETFAEDILNNLSELTCDSDKKFTSNVQNLKMLAEVCEDNCFKFYKKINSESSENGSNQNQPALFTSFNLSILYKSFFKKKYKIYQQEKNKLFMSKPGLKKIFEEKYDEFIENHQNMAFELLLSQNEVDIFLGEKYFEKFKKENPKIFSLITDKEKLKNEELDKAKQKNETFWNDIINCELNTGIVDVINNKPRFIHRSYAEYLISLFFYDNFYNQSVEINLEIGQLLFKEILTKTKHQSLRKFLNEFLKNKNNNYDIFEKILTDLDMKQKIYDDEQAIYIQMKEKNNEIIKFLLEISIKEDDEEENEIISNNKQISLRYAMRFKNIEIIKLLIEKKVNLQHKDKHGYTPLHYIVENVYDESSYDIVDEMISILIQHGAKIDEKNNHGMTALHCAIDCELHDPDNCSSDEDYQDEESETDSLNSEYDDEESETDSLNSEYDDEESETDSLNNENDDEESETDSFDSEEFDEETGDIYEDFDDNYGNPDIVKILIKKGANLNEKDNKGQTPLHYAVTSKNREIVEKLLETKTVNINDQDNDGMTPLHYAIKIKYVLIVYYLIGANAEIYITNNNGDTAVDLAVESQSKRIKNLLIGTEKLSVEDFKRLNEN